jgi:hypothetical protein
MYRGEKARSQRSRLVKEEMFLVLALGSIRLLVESCSLLAVFVPSWVLLSLTEEIS